MTVDELIKRLERAPRSAFVQLEVMSSGHWAEDECRSVSLNFNRREVTLTSGADEDGTTGSLLVAD